MGGRSGQGINRGGGVISPSQYDAYGSDAVYGRGGGFKIFDNRTIFSAVNGGIGRNNNAFRKARQTGSGSSVEVRGGQGKRKDRVAARHREYRNSLSKAIKQKDQLSSGERTYTTVTKTEAKSLLNRFKRSKTITEDGFSTGSSSKKLGHKGSKGKTKIVIKAAGRSTKGYKVGRFSRDAQKNIIFDRGARFRLVSNKGGVITLQEIPIQG